MAQEVESTDQERSNETIDLCCCFSYDSAATLWHQSAGFSSRHLLSEIILQRFSTSDLQGEYTIVGIFAWLWRIELRVYDLRAIQYRQKPRETKTLELVISRHGLITADQRTSPLSA